MKFTTTKIRGTGIGQSLGSPRLNMLIPDNLPLVLQQGVYAAKAKIKEEKYIGVLYYGSEPTLGDTEVRLGIHLLDTAGFYANEGEEVEIEIGKHIRSIQKFDLPEQLVREIQKDEQMARK